MTTKPDHTPPAEPPDLRRMILTSAPGAFGWKSTDEFPRISAVLVDVPFEGKTLTVLSAWDGSASLYFSSGGGIIGGHAHDHIRTAAPDLVRAAEAILDFASPSFGIDYPGQDSVRFHMLTGDGVMVLDSPMSFVRNRAHPCAPLFKLAEWMIHALATLPQRGKSAAGPPGQAS